MNMKKKLQLILFFGGCITYYIIVRYTGRGIPCLFFTLFHLKCPGCGVTSLLLFLSMGKWPEAFKSNPYLFLSLPYLAYLLFYQLWCWLTDQTMKLGRLGGVILYSYLAGLVLFGIARNMISL